MKKTILILTMVLLLVPAGLFAGVFDLSLGVLAQNKLPYDAPSGDFDEDMFTDIDNYAFGADIRTRLLFAEVGIAALYEQVEHPTTTEMTPSFSGLVTGGLSLDLLGLVRVGLGLGPRVVALFPEGEDAIFYTDSVGELSADNLMDALTKSDLTWRATVDLKLGSILLGVNYMVDSDGFTIENSDFTKLMPTADLFKQGRIGASVLFTIF